MQDVETLEQRLDRLEAGKAVADVVHGYALAVARGDHAAVIALFTDDATMTVMQAAPGGGAPTVRNSVSGMAELKAFFEASLRPGVLNPMVTNLTVEVTGDEARSVCTMTASGVDAAPRFVGVYVDTFRRTPQWRFTSRTFTIAGGAP